MGIHYQVVTESGVYTVVDDVTLSYQVLITGQVVDEITGQPFEGGFSVQVGRPDLHAKIMRDGLVVVSGYPARIFPNWGVASYSVSLTISAPGYTSRTYDVVLPQANPLAVQLRPQPVRIQGRVIEVWPVVNPLVGARVILVDDPSAPPPTEHLQALRTPLQFEHGSGVTVREYSLTPSGASRQLTQPAAGGSLTVQIDNRSGLGPGDVLRFGTDIGYEYVVVDTVVAIPANMSLPGDVTLRGSLFRSLPAGALVQKVTPAVGIQNTHLARVAEPGDGLLILDDVLDVDAIQIADPVVNKIEYHAVGALSDSDGYYHLDGMGRVQSVFLQATSGVHSLTRPWMIDFGQPVNTVDLSLTF